MQFILSVMCIIAYNTWFLKLQIAYSYSFYDIYYIQTIDGLYKTDKNFDKFEKINIEGDILDVSCG